MFRIKNYVRNFLIIVNYIFSAKNNLNQRIIALHEVDNIELFEEKIKFLITNFNVISIEDIEKFKNKDFVVLTFDDGYNEWANEVREILIKYKCPATFFINSGIFQNNNDIFVKQNLKRTKKLYLIEQDGVQKLANHNLFIIGSHTKNHINLGVNYSIDRYNDEILEDKKYLENLTNKSIKFFAYPFGRKENITENSIKYLRNLKFKYIFSIIPGNFNSSYKVQPRDSLSIYDSNILWQAWLSGAYDFKSRQELKEVNE